MQSMISFWLFLILQLTFTPLLSSAEEISFHHRRILHHPFFPADALPPTAQPPQSQPPVQQQRPKQPFSTLSPPNNNNNQGNPFFPAFPSPPPPPPASSLPTFPANISSIILPRSSSSSKPISRKLVVVAVTLSVVSAALVTAVAAFLIHHRRHRGLPGKVPRTESLRLFPPNTDSSDGGHKASRNVSGTSSEFLYPGTASGIDDEERRETNRSNPTASSLPGYQKLGSPELRPLPPLPRHNFRQSGPQVVSPINAGEDINDDEGEEEFFSPRASSSGKCSPEAFLGMENQIFGRRSSDSRTASYPSSHSVSPTNSMSSSPFVPLHLSPRSLRSKSPDSVVDFLPPSRPPPAIPPPTIDQPPTRGSTSAAPTRLPPPPPPPLPPLRYWETPAVQVTIQDQRSGPPTHVAPTRPPVVMQNHTEVLSTTVDEAGERIIVEGLKPKLKPLHWDKVRASSDRAMVWDQLKSSSFQLNEEMIETLFMVNTSSHLGQKDSNWRPMPQMPNQENRVLDPKKSQNIAILLRALNVTIEEVCEALLEGSADTLGTELLESLLKMAPTKEEERKLKEFNDQSPFKLGPAEKFLKAVLDIPFAFQRVEAMLYIANFDSEVDYLKRSFETIEVACEELRNNRMFLKLLEAVLKTGNRMNVGTNRGDAEAFKLDTLLKLVDIKGTDGKTTLLHFVVQEISRAEGCRLANADHRGPDNDQSSFQEDIEFRKQGLQVVSGLSSELTNVKKAAAMDSETLSSDATKLLRGLAKIREVLKSNEETAARGITQKFSESMSEFLKKAEAEIVKIQGKERVSVSLVREITEYFHGNSAKEEAHPFRIFMVVRDFISVLDRVCKEVGKINERSLVSSTRQFPPPVNSTQLPVFPELNMKQQFSSSDDESSSSSS